MKYEQVSESCIKSLLKINIANANFLHSFTYLKNFKFLIQFLRTLGPWRTQASVKTNFIYLLFFKKKNVATRFLLSGHVRVLVPLGLGLGICNSVDQEIEKQNGKQEEYSVMGLYCYWVHLEGTSKDLSTAFTSHSVALENLSYLGNKDIERENVTMFS